mmetsp:Transcript_66371/g.184916  ORF Transcript_66371/g.184916 Transcript_66371/m.184916 type:complete len:375 (+) Transcript_66371:1458-2582(+)
MLGVFQTCCGHMSSETSTVACFTSTCRRAASFSQNPHGRWLTMAHGSMRSGPFSVTASSWSRVTSLQGMSSGSQACTARPSSTRLSTTLVPKTSLATACTAECCCVCSTIQRRSRGSGPKVECSSSCPRALWRSMGFCSRGTRRPSSARSGSTSGRWTSRSSQQACRHRRPLVRGSAFARSRTTTTGPEVLGRILVRPPSATTTLGGTGAESRLAARCFLQRRHCQRRRHRKQQQQPFRTASARCRRMVASGKLCKTVQAIAPSRWLTRRVVRPRGASGSAARPRTTSLLRIGLAVSPGRWRAMRRVQATHVESDGPGYERPPRRRERLSQRIKCVKPIPGLQMCMTTKRCARHAGSHIGGGVDRLPSLCCSCC